MHITSEPLYRSASVKNEQILLEQSFTAHMPLFTVTSDQNAAKRSIKIYIKNMTHQHPSHRWLLCCSAEKNLTNCNVSATFNYSCLCLKLNYNYNWHLQKPMWDYCKSRYTPSAGVIIASCRTVATQPAVPAINQNIAITKSINQHLHILIL